ncbi:hypothetical protein [Ochrobactrum sp. AN78]|uniref:hypothetical protein n=1 Tax=Ochrobactrum sp. AN78 TaxID=3039853 RepID=UPI002989BEDE|nr:hypothetical protein [Ochrobactrum sp. AN78]MDH7791995.1 hypothetical protein [Ochrobactrum sp. AN78]
MQILNAKYVGNSASITVQFSGKQVVVEYGPVAPPLDGRMHSPFIDNKDLATKEILAQTNQLETEIRAAVADYLASKKG